MTFWLPSGSRCGRLKIVAKVSQQPASKCEAGIHGIANLAHYSREYPELQGSVAISERVAVFGSPVLFGLYQVGKKNHVFFFAGTLQLEV